MKDFPLYYELTRKLASKTLRSTYLACSTLEPQRQVIVKVFDNDCISPNHEENLWLVNTLLSFKHPHIIPILDIAIDGRENPYVVSEYRAHGSLRQHLARLSPEHMDWEEAINIVVQIGQALSYSHKQHITHGNIKPENIFYNEADKVQLTDFSLAPFIDTTRLGYKYDLSITRYMAPEQFIGKIDQQSDQYALACLAYELITGHTPFEAQNFSALWRKHTLEFVSPLSGYVPELPLPIDLATLKALAKNPAERFPDINTFLASLNSRPTSYVPSISLSSPNNFHAPLSARTGDPFFTELANRTLSSTLPKSRQSDIFSSSPAISQQSFTASATSHTSSQHRRTESLPPTTESVHPNNSPQIFDTSQSMKMQSLYGQVTGEFPFISDAQIIADISAISKQHRKRRNYFAGISALVATIVLISLLMPHFFHDTFGTTSPMSAVPSSGSLVQGGQNNTATATAKHTGTVALQPPTAKKITIPALPEKSNPAPQPTSAAKQTSPPIPPTQSVPTAIAVPQGIGSVRINAGGSAAGVFGMDEDFSDTTPGDPSQTLQVSSTIDTSGVSYPAPESVYQSARLGDCLYTITNLAPNASYLIRLHFAETYWTHTGKRLFNVSINGKLVLSNFDIVATAGAKNTAVIETSVMPANSHGTITIQFASVKDKAQIDGIEILSD